MAVISMASTAASLAGQQMSANAQAESMEENAQLRANQEADAAGQRIGGRAKQARRERARARVAAGEAGVAGQSFEAMLQNSLAQQNQDAAVIAKNSKMAGRAAQSTARAKTAGSGVNPFAAAGSLASAGASGHSSGLQIKAAKKSLQIGD